MDVYHRIRRATSFAALMLLALVSTARAAALELYETGAPDLGTASAGRTAMAADASTAAANPAGMTLLDQTQLLTAPGALLPSTNFDVGPKTTTSGTAGGNAGVFTPLGSFFFVYRLTDRFRLGVSLFSDYGLSANYSHQWVGRYYASKESLISGKINPAIAYRVSEWLSVGGGFNVSVARLEFKSRINNIIPGRPDGGLSLESWDVVCGANFGVLLTPMPKLRVGLTYQSPEYYNFGFRPDLSNLGPGLSAIKKRIGGAHINIPMTEPQQVMASALYEVLPNWSLMGNVGWQNWAEFGEFPVGISATNQRSIAANLHFSNTYSIAIGQQYRIAEKWLWSAGFAFDSSPVSRTNRIAALPIDRQLRYGTGLQYQINHNVTAGAAWEFLDAGPGPYTASRGPLAGTVQGHYSTNYLNFVALNLIWKF
jgi:long-chain fatty acid transport protein